MSIETKLGRRLIDLRDMTKSAITSGLMEINVKNDLSLTENQLRDISLALNSKVESTFDVSFNNIMSVLKEE
jgi:hypothetical protein